MKSFRREQKSQQIQKKERSGSRSNTGSPPSDDAPKTSQHEGHLATTDGNTRNSTLSDDQLSEHSWLTGGPTTFRKSQIDLNSTYLEPWSAVVPADISYQSPPGFNYLGAGRGDPFNTTVRDAGPQAESLMDHCKFDSTQYVYLGSMLTIVY